MNENNENKDYEIYTPLSIKEESNMSMSYNIYSLFSTGERKALYNDNVCM